MIRSIVTTIVTCDFCLQQVSEGEAITLHSPRQEPELFAHWCSAMCFRKELKAYQDSDCVASFVNYMLHDQQKRIEQS